MIAIEARRTRRALTTAALTMLVVPLGACTAHGTDAVYTPAQGVNERSGEVDVLNAMIVSSEAGEGRVIAGLTNNNQSEADELTGISGVEDDSSVQVQLEGGATQVPAGGFLQLADSDGPRITVSGEAVSPGSFVRLSFEFGNAQPVELHVPVVEPGEDFADVVSPSSSASSPSSSESPAEGESSPSEGTESE